MRRSPRSTRTTTSAPTGAKPRPAYRRMCEDVKAGIRDGVIVWHNDRLHRNTRELEDFIDLVEATSIAVATVTSGDYDLTTTTGRAMARIACALARLESEDKSRRIKRQQLQAAQEGKRSGGGTRGYGYQAGHRKVIPQRGGRHQGGGPTDPGRRAAPVGHPGPQRPWHSDA